MVITKRLTLPPPRLTLALATAPRAADLALARGLARAPADRFPTASDFVAALSRAFH
jgi:hypothetical protein